MEGQQILGGEQRGGGKEGGRLRQAQLEGHAEAAKEGQRNSTRVQGVRVGRQTQRPRKALADIRTLGVTDGQKKTRQESQKHTEGTDTDRQKQTERQTDRQTRTVSGRETEIWMPPAQNRTRRSAAARPTSSGRGRGPRDPGGQVRAARSPPPYLGHAIPHDPGGGGPGAPPARRPENARVTAALMAQAGRLQPGRDPGA